MPLDPDRVKAAIDSMDPLAFVSLLVETGHRLTSIELTPDMVPIERYKRVESGPDQGRIYIVSGETPSGESNYTLHFIAPFAPPKVDTDSLDSALAAADKFPLTEEAKRRCEDEVNNILGRVLS